MILIGKNSMNDFIQKDKHSDCKKVGIFTFHRSPNYGAQFQAFALYRFLSDNYSDNSVSVIDFTCKGNSDEYYPNNFINRLSYSRFYIIRFFKRILLKLRFEKKYKMKYDSFQDFTKKYISISNPEREIFDYIFLGSDQIWNPRITAGYMDAYFGFDTKYQGNVVASYAASCGSIAELTSEEIDSLVNRVHHIDYIGVRERSLDIFLKNKGFNSELTVDPTFLFNKSEYNDMFSVPDAEDDYILEYALQYNKELDEVANSISKRLGCKVIRLCGYIDPLTRHMGKSRIFSAGPNDFLNLVANARYIVTNSFHGVAFSIIYRKSFNVVLPSVRQSRIRDILTDLKLEERIVIPGSLVSDDIDYESREAILNKMIKHSKDFINAIMEHNNANQ